MSFPNTGPARRITQGALVALLMTSVATAALAAPKAQGQKTAAAAARDAKLDALQRQIDAMQAQMAQMQQSQGAANDARVVALEQQLDTVNKQLADVTAAQTVAASDIVTLKAPAVAVSLPNGKPSLASADGRFTANLRAIIMMDAGKYFQDNNLGPAVTNRDLNEGVNFRRARIGFDGRVFKDFEYAIVYEFGGSGVEEAGRLYEASVTYAALKPFRIKVGAFEPNVGLAAATSTSAMPLFERPAPAEAARNVAAGDSRTAVQLSANGVFGSGDTGLAARWLVSSALTGNTLGGTQQFDEQTAWIGRLALAPYYGTELRGHLGANFQYVMQPNDAVGPTGAGARYPIQIRDRPELRLDGTRLVDTGAIDAAHATVYGAEAAFGFRSFLVEGEYFKYEIERRNSALSDPDFSGWYVQGSWVLTGEPRAYDPIEGRFAAPRQNYNFNPAAGTWGAFEIAARYSNLDLKHNDCGAGRATPAAPAPCFDAVRGGEQKITSVGANWYLNPAMRLMLNFQHVDIDRFNAAGVQVGQKYDAVALRAQFTY